VNSLAADRYADNTFSRTNLTLLSGNNTFTAVAKDNVGRTDTSSATANLPSTVSYTYDLNGNLSYDGNRAFDYDDENQLIRVAVTNNWKSEFTYDGTMRRRIRKEFLWQNGGWALSNEVHYIYDGKLVIQERDGNNVPTVSYTRGPDVSRALEGAGGIGGLLARTDHSTITPQHAFYHADGNGNVTMLINALQLGMAKYIYDPFGNVLSKAGPLCDANLYRFSSKEYHPASGSVYYLYRFYDPNLQRWANRDPISEIGHRNIRGACVNCYRAFASDAGTFRFCGNIPTMEYDSFGLLTKEDCDDQYVSDMKKATKKAAECLTSAIKWGVIGEVILGGGGLAVGGVIGNVPGAGTGLVIGTGVNLIIDVCHVHHCQKEVDKMKQSADKAHDDCLKQVKQ
jgi:RHS repeat-associated protein